MFGVKYGLLARLYLRLWRTLWGKHHRVAIFNTNQTNVGQRRGCGENIQYPCGRTRELLCNKGQNTSDTSLKLASSFIYLFIFSPFTVSGGIPVTPTSFPFNRNHICFVLFTTDNSGNVQMPHLERRFLVFKQWTEMWPTYCGVKKKIISRKQHAEFASGPVRSASSPTFRRQSRCVGTRDSQSDRSGRYSAAPPSVPPSALHLYAAHRNHVYRAATSEMKIITVTPNSFGSKHLTYWIVRARGWRARVKSRGRSTLPAAAEPSGWLTAAGGRWLFRRVTTPRSPDALPACAFTAAFPLSTLLLLFKSEGHDVTKCFEPVGEVQCKRLQTGSWITADFCNHSQESIHNQSL